MMSMKLCGRANFSRLEHLLSREGNDFRERLGHPWKFPEELFRGENESSKVESCVPQALMLSRRIETQWSSIVYGGWKNERSKIKPVIGWLPWWRWRYSPASQRACSHLARARSEAASYYLKYEIWSLISKLLRENATVNPNRDEISKVFFIHQKNEGQAAQSIGRMVAKSASHLGADSKKRDGWRKEEGTLTRACKSYQIFLCLSRFHTLSRRFSRKARTKMKDKEIDWLGK